MADLWTCWWPRATRLPRARTAWTPACCLRGRRPQPCEHLPQRMCMLPLAGHHDLRSLAVVVSFHRCGQACFRRLLMSTVTMSHASHDIVWPTPYLETLPKSGLTHLQAPLQGLPGGVAQAAAHRRARRRRARRGARRSAAPAQSPAGCGAASRAVRTSLVASPLALSR